MKILAVDDDEVALDLLTTCLLENGYEDFETAESSAEAMEMISSAERHFDCILLDIDMPVKDGVTTCAEIRALKEYLHTPIIMITRRHDGAMIELAFSKGATDYITKPYGFIEVNARIKVAERLVLQRQAALDSYLALQQAPKATKKSAGMALDTTINVESDQISSDNLLPLTVFENYLYRMTRADGSKVSMIAIKIAAINQIFTELDAEEFVSFLKTFVEAVVMYSGRDKVFLSHMGNGVLLCAADGVYYKDPSIVEKELQAALLAHATYRKRFTHIPVQLSVGVPLTLPTTTKPKFSRAMKVCMARLESRDANRPEREEETQVA